MCSDATSRGLPERVGCLIPVNVQLHLGHDGVDDEHGILRRVDELQHEPCEAREQGMRWCRKVANLLLNAMARCDDFGPINRGKNNFKKTFFSLFVFVCVCFPLFAGGGIH